MFKQKPFLILAFLFCGIHLFSQTTALKISQLPTATAESGTDVMLLDIGGVTSKITVANFANSLPITTAHIPLSDGEIIIGGTDSFAHPQSLFGDATISDAGQLTLASVTTGGTFAIGNGSIVFNTKGLDTGTVTSPTNIVLTTGSNLLSGTYFITGTMFGEVAVAYSGSSASSGSSTLSYSSMISGSSTLSGSAINSATSSYAVLSSTAINSGSAAISGSSIISGSAIHSAISAYALVSSTAQSGTFYFGSDYIMMSGSTITLDGSYTLYGSPPTPITYGLVAYWPLNGSGADATGNGNNMGPNDGTVTYTTGIGGRQCGVFDGSSGLITSGTIGYFPEWTVFSWVTTTTAGGNMVGAAADIAVVLQLDGSGDLAVSINTSGEGGPGLVSSGVNIADGNLHFVGASLSSSGTLSFFLDGSIVNQQSVGTNEGAWGGTNDTLGESDGGGSWLTGSMQGAGVYNRVLSGSEIVKLSGTYWPY